MMTIISYKLKAYADEGHNLNGVTEHVYRSMEDYFRRCLSLDPDDEKPEASTVPTE